MSHSEHLSSWEKDVASRFQDLSKPQAAVLALMSFGIVLARSCGLTTVSTMLAELRGGNADSVKQRLREWYLSKDRKCGKQRREVDVSTLFAPLFRWILDLWEGNDLVIALDATALGDRFVVLAMSVMYRGSAIPVSWTVLEADAKGSWNLHWKRMLKTVAPAVPKSMNVIVMTDRGLWSRELYRAIRMAQWHPFMRIQRSGTWRPKGTRGFVPMSQLLPRPETCLYQQGTAFKTSSSRLNCTLLACWDEQAEEPWLILTDIECEDAEAVWYTMRFWIEHSFRQLKRGVWKWHNTKMTDPERVERVLFPVALATLWTVALARVYRPPFEKACSRR